MGSVSNLKTASCDTAISLSIITLALNGRVSWIAWDKHCTHYGGIRVGDLHYTCTCWNVMYIVRTGVCCCVYVCVTYMYTYTCVDTKNCIF